ncbi:hypothetical protein CRM22_008775 [Opisthorchis felineus]|uniref:Chitinase domain-containing protein 1 n=2 Tax=Opisthorchis felineus TaxID=147828 RepID=A0A4S2LGN3_OPIFE|nr:hypothetical protein CRM22_008775 [Opisthorchis felineus]TGZ59979.1 hypothetical protein CRM22_008775 [Opisthorchis felineus]
MLFPRNKTCFKTRRSVIFWLVCLCIVVQLTLSQRVPSVSQKIDLDEFLDSFSSYNMYTVTQKATNGSVLAYVTPWNKRGFELAETFAAKFTLISPVWFQVLGRKKAYSVTGLPEVNKDWMARLKAVNPSIKIVPRFDFREWQAPDFADTLGDRSGAEQCLANILRILKHYEFDGAVIELWSFFVGAPEESLYNFIELIGQSLRDIKMVTVLVIPPPVYRGELPGRFTKKQFERLRNHVDYFSLMTYDYSPPSGPGPNSPISWVEKCILHFVPHGSHKAAEKRAQILTGFNFYGLHHIPERRFGDYILGHQFVHIVNQSRADFIWDSTVAEHYLKFRDDNGHENFVYYPTVASISRRIDLVEYLGTGISIWEIGQGLDSFFSLF